jgi:hypothetical protein
VLYSGQVADGGASVVAQNVVYEHSWTANGDCPPASGWVWS